VRAASRRAAGPALVLALTAAVTGCGGGFSSAPATPPTRHITSYAALGDGFTAAPYAGTSVGDDGCLRSKDNYPALLADQLDVTQLRDVSCTGATTTSLTTETKPPTRKKTVPAQLTAVDRDTDLVTVGAGIEDRELLPHLFAICLALPCGGAVPPQTVLADVNAMAASLTTAVRRIQDAAPDALVVLIGYPRILPDTGSCDALPKMEQPSLDAANLAFDAINRAISATARETGAGYLDVARLSAGHELCSGDAWVQGSKTKRGEPVSYHPVAAEQKAVADALADLVRNQ
jgi:hypothetical protein